MSASEPSPLVGAGRGYLDTPSMGLPHPATVVAVHAALEEWAAGRAHHAVWERSMEACREHFACLSEVRTDEVGLLSSVVPAVSAAASVLARGRGAVVVHRREFRSLLLPVLAQVDEERLRWVDGPYTARTFTDAVDDRTDAVVVSAVSSHDGGRPELAELAAASSAAGARLVVDGTQAMGLVVPDLPVTQPLMFACAGYKGLRSPRGVAYAVGDDELADAFLTPSAYGMADAAEHGSYGPPLRPRRGGPGLDQSPVWLAWVGAEAALAQLLDEPAATREQRVLSLSGRLRGELETWGPPPQVTDLPSPIVTFEHPDADAIVSRLAEGGVRAAARLGRVRLGLHGDSDENDLDLAIETLQGALLA